MSDSHPKDSYFQNPKFGIIHFLSFQNEAQLSEADMRDGFSTLFAVKLQDQKGVYDPKAYPLEYLLQVNVLNSLSRNQEPAQQPSPYVYLKSEDHLDLNLKKVAYP